MFTINESGSWGNFKWLSKRPLREVAVLHKNEAQTEYAVTAAHKHRRYAEQLKHDEQNMI